LTEAGRQKMKLSRRDLDFSNVEQWRDWHVITLSKSQYGKSALDFYARVLHGVDTQTIEAFGKEIGESDETRTLYPKAPVSAIPERYLWFVEQTNLTIHLPDFWRNMKEFVEMNRSTIHARKILVDLHRDGSLVPDFFLTAVERSFAEHFKEDEIDEIVIMK
jgi:hypothetical protein